MWDVLDGLRGRNFFPPTQSPVMTVPRPLPVFATALATAAAVLRADPGARPITAAWSRQFEAPRRGPTDAVPPAVSAPTRSEVLLVT